MLRDRDQTLSLSPPRAGEVLLLAGLVIGILGAGAAAIWQMLA